MLPGKRKRYVPDTESDSDEDDEEPPKKTRRTSSMRARSTRNTEQQSTGRRTRRSQPDWEEEVQPTKRSASRSKSRSSHMNGDLDDLDVSG